MKLRVMLYFSDCSNSVIEIFGEKGLEFFMIVKELADYWNIVDENDNPIEETGYEQEDIDKFIKFLRKEN